MTGLDGQLAMLFRMMWHAGRYRVPEVLGMEVFDCCIVLGVDQAHKPNRPAGAPPDLTPELTVAERLAIPAGVKVMSPGAINAAIEWGKTD